MRDVQEVKNKKKKRRVEFSIIFVLAKEGTVQLLRDGMARHPGGDASGSRPAGV